jgi:hypothetical protein
MRKSGYRTHVTNRDAMYIDDLIGKRRTEATTDGQIAALAVAEKGSFEAAGKYRHRKICCPQTSSECRKRTRSVCSSCRGKGNSARGCRKYLLAGSTRSWDPLAGEVCSFTEPMPVTSRGSTLLATVGGACDLSESFEGEVAGRQFSTTDRRIACAAFTGQLCVSLGSQWTSRLPSSRWQTRAPSKLQGNTLASEDLR